MRGLPADPKQRPAQGWVRRCYELTADHAEKLTDLPDDQMADILPTCRRLAKATVRAL